MPFEPAGPDQVRCTLCSDVIATSELALHACLPAAVRARRAAGINPVAADGTPAAAAPPEEPVPGGVWGGEQAEADPEPLTFDLAGRTFRAVEEFSLGLQMDLAAAWDEGTVPTSVAIKLVRGIVHPDDERAFDRLLYSKDEMVDAAELRDALVSVVRQMAARPSLSSSPSPRGRAPGGDGSTGAVSSPGWTPGP